MIDGCAMESMNLIESTRYSPPTRVKWGLAHNEGRRAAERDVM